MNHPRRFDEDDPILAKVRQVCLALPGADMKVSHGRPAFFTKKIFAIYGAESRSDGDACRFDQSLVFLPDPEEAAALGRHERVFVPAYWGPSGWLGYDLTPRKTDWTEVCELVEESFRITAAKLLIAELDCR